MRVAIYARYSSDRQSERSIDDQVEVCRRAATARGWSVVGAFTDAAISGAAMANRPGLLAALAAAERGELDVLLCEDEDRIARNLEHLAHVVNRLDYAGARLSTLTTETVETMHVAFKGLIGQDYLKNLSAKTKRGMHSNAEKGLATGSRTYGYRSAPGGELTIVEAEAAVIREIFARYGAGETGRAICADLNSRGVPSPAGGQWAASTIRGSRSRASGLLYAEIYTGVKVWNRLEVRKDPQTGKRLTRPRPAAEWKRTPVPQLRIVSDEAWAAVSARQVRAGTRSLYARKPRKAGLFSGLIKCGACGGSMTAFNSRGRLICATRREKGPAACSSSRTVDRREVEARALKGLRERLLSPAAVRTYVRLYHEAYQAEAAAATAQVAPLRKRLAELERTIPRLVDKICDGTDTPETNRRLRELEAEKVELAARLVQAEADAPPPIVLHPTAADRYAEKVAQLQAHLARTPDGDQATDADAPSQATIDAVRDMVVMIEVLAPDDDEQPPHITLHGALAALMAPDAGHEAPRLYKVVAGARSSLTQTPALALPIAC